MTILQIHNKGNATGCDLIVRDLGRMDYAAALAVQRQLQSEVIESRRAAHSPMHLLLVEHDPPVITVSRRPSAARHLIATPAQLAAAGVEIAQTDRGGDITYHGPGQLVVYPILDLNALGLRLNGYLRFLEQIVIDVLAQFGLGAARDPSATGVWIEAHGLQSVGFAAANAKICAIGVRISRWVTMHGLALNVHTNLDHFNLIVPCGLAGRSVTSMSRELRDRCPSMDEVKAALVQQFRKSLEMVRAREGTLSRERRV